MKLHIVPFCGLIGLGTGSCVDGPGLFSKDGSAATKYEVFTTSENGVVSGDFSAASSATQIIEIKEGTIRGSGVAFPPGSLAIDTSVALQEGAKIVSATVANELGISGTVSSGGPAVVLSSSIAVDSSAPFKLTIPRKSKSTLALATTYYAVIYRVFSAAKNKNLVGVIPHGSIVFKDDSVEIETLYFGSYQLAETSAKITEAVQKSTEAPILTKNEERELPAVSLKLNQPSFITESRTVTVTAKLSAEVKLSKCVVLYQNTTASAPFASNSLDAAARETLSSAIALSFDYAIAINSAFTLRMYMECNDEFGRTLSATNAKDLEIPDTSGSGGNNNPTVALAFLGIDAHSTSPKLNRVLSPNATRTMDASCDVALGVVTVFVDVDAQNERKQTVPCSNNRFQVVLDARSAGCTAGSGIFCTGATTRGYHVYAAQSFAQYDETVIFVHPDINLIREIDSTNFTTPVFTAASGAGEFLILNSDITLTGPWSIGTNLSAPFDGDLHTISGFNISQTGAANISNVGMFSVISSSLRHVKLNAPAIAIALSSSAYADKVGFFAGTLSATGKIEGVTVYDGSISDSSSGISTQIGGIVGYNTGTISSAMVIGRQIASYSAQINAPNAIKVGGLVGYSSASSTLGLISDSKVERTMIVGSSGIGGLVGSASAASTATVVARSKFSGAISSSELSPAMINVGGIIGDIVPSAIVSEVQAKVDVTCAASTVYGVGGIAGSLSGTIMHADAALSSSSCRLKVGGIAGLALTGTSWIEFAKSQINISAACGTCGSIFGFGDSTVGTVRTILLPAGSRIDAVLPAPMGNIPTVITTGSHLVFDSTDYSTAISTICPVATPLENICSLANFSAQTSTDYSANWGFAMTQEWTLSSPSNLPILARLPD